MNDAEQITVIPRRLAETIAWCSRHANPADPQNSLRTLVLRPTNLSSTPDRFGNHDYHWGTVEEIQRVVNDLADRRAELLRQNGNLPDGPAVDLAGGRLLVSRPQESIWCGVSETESEGFVDILDVPAWDTWVYYVQDAPLPEEPQDPMEPGVTAFDYLLCWIPADFVPLVEKGIYTDPVDCFEWATDFSELHTRLLGGPSRVLGALADLGLLG